MHKELSPDSDLLRQTVMYITQVKGFQDHFWSELLITGEETKTRLEELTILYDLRTPLGCCAWTGTVCALCESTE